MPNENSNLENDNFEQLKCNISDATKDILSNCSCHPDSNYCNTKIKNLNTPYILPEKFQRPYF